ncbi:MAG: hypothetical protein Q8O29_01745 [Polaromonas sp.]|uniref:hypothetical protein n=1 Tax=Polaromonas sp. TaxID=1869339 RepID=UPI0027367C97|nr:hypothetical protein [Polaromonas sp.]MDP2817001.1 hypothetical protein [Polaromonas sp.]
MTIKHALKTILLAAVLAGATAPALAQVTINIGIAPPPVLYEVVPVLAPTQAWAPGYWAWNGDRHVWVRGRAMSKRDGYRWAPDNWVQTGNGYVRQPGYWVRDTSYAVKEKKPKKDKHDKHRGKGHGDDDHDDDHHGGKHGSKD